MGKGPRFKLTKPYTLSRLIHRFDLPPELSSSLDEFLALQQWVGNDLAKTISDGLSLNAKSF
jgi:hypothetical protein